jgi:chemotaxis protein methyltransferase CheR
MDLTDAEFTLFQKYLVSTCGIEVPPQKRYLFATRLKSLLTELKCHNFSELYGMLMAKENVRLHEQVVEAMTTRETSFFRDTHPYEALRETILPQQVKHKRQSHAPALRRFRMWSAGCSTGEEPYSMAMTFAHWRQLHDVQGAFPLEILATDISGQALDVAQGGAYDRNKVDSAIPHLYREFYLSKKEDGFAVADSIKEVVRFCRMDLTASIRFLGFFDVVFCRNVLIYFSQEVRHRVLTDLLAMLNYGGVLIMGASEMVSPEVLGTAPSVRAEHVGPTTYYVKPFSSERGSV